MSNRARLSVLSEPSSPALVDAVSEQFCREAGAGPEERELIALTTRRLVQFVIERCYPNDSAGEIQVSYELLHRAIHVQVHDWGHPLTSFGGPFGLPPDELTGLADRVEDLRLVNLGRDGKRLSFSKPIADPAPSTAAAGDSVPSSVGPPAPDVRDEIEVRDLRPGEEEAVSELLYGNYALTYPHADFYRPRWVAEQVAAGSVLSSVAVVEGEIVGHHAILLRDPEAVSAETGVAVVHTAYRGLGVFGRLFEHTLARAHARGLAAIYGRAVTVHPYSQRSERAHGYRETALMLGAVGTDMSMAGLSRAGRRTAHLLSVRVLRPAARPIAVPTRYADAIQSTYAHLELELNPVPPDGAAGQISWNEDAEHGTALIRIAGWSSGASDALLGAVRHLDQRHHDVIYADIDLHAVSDVDAAVTALNERFFFYAGLVPFGPNTHDHLRLQRINSDNVETETIVCDSPFAGRLREWVADDRAQVDR